MRLQSLEPYSPLRYISFNENSRRRVIIFAHDEATLEDPWKNIPGTNVFLVGGYKTTGQLRKMLVSYPNPRRILDKPLSGNTYYKMVDYLQISKRSYKDTPATY